MKLFGYVAMLCAFGCAAVVARRRAEHRPVAYVLAAGVLVDVLRMLLVAHVLRAPGAPPPPWSGMMRAASILDSALFLAWPASLAAAALHVLARRRAWTPAPFLAVAIAAVAILNPRGAALAHLYLGAELAAAMTGAACVVAWIVALRRGRAADLSAACIAVLCAGHLAGVVLTGPYRTEAFSRWDLAILAYVLTFALVAILHLGDLLWTRTDRT